MATDGAITKPITITDKIAARRAKGALEYLMKNDGKGAVVKLAERWGIEILAKDDNTKIAAAFGLDKIAMPNRWSQRDEISMSVDQRALSITGYDNLRTQLYINYSSKNDRIIFEDKAMIVKLKSGVMSIALKSGENFRFDAAAWIDAQGFDVGEVHVDDPAVVLLDDGTRKITVVIRSFNSWIDANEDGRRFNMDVFFLTRGLEP